MRRFIVVCALLLAVIPTCHAQSELWDQLGMDRLAKAGRVYGAGVELTESLSVEDGVSALAGQASHMFPALLRGAVKGVLTLTAIVLLCAMADGLNTLSQSAALPAPLIAGALAVTAVSAGRLNSMIGFGRSAIGQMESFSQALLPVMAGCMAVGGNISGGAVRQMATASFSTLLIGVIDRLLVPMLYAYLACCCAYAAVGNQGLKHIAQLIKSSVTTVLTTLLVVFSAYITVSGAIAGTADAAAVKAVKTAITTAVPVVGRILSETAETVLVSAGLLRNTAGLFGMIAVLGICLAPFMRLGLQYLVYKAAAALCATVAEGRLAELLGEIAGAFGLILGMTGACALLMLIGIVSGMLGGMG